MSEYLDGVFKNADTIRGVAFKLLAMSDAAATICMPDLSNHLFELHKELLEAEKAIRKTVGKETTDRLAGSMLGAKNTIAACLAGAKLQKEEEK